jgi:predicted nucleic acid-binding protein
VIILDTGVLYALADRRDTLHKACVRWLTAAPRPLIVPPLVIAETCYLIGQHLGATAEATFLDVSGPGQSTMYGQPKR